MHTELEFECRPTWLDEPCPCDGCRYAQECAQERRACTAFALFVGGASRARWEFAPRTDATRETYAQIFGES